MNEFDFKMDVYNKFDALKDGVQKISDYLVENSQDLFKLLKYIKPTDIPLSMPDLTNEQKASMICSDALEMYDTNSSVSKNVIYQIEVDEAYWIAEPQVRIEVGNFIPFDSYRGYAEINFLIVVPNKQRLFTNGVNTLADRSVAIALELIKQLNGKMIPYSCFYSPMFMNKSAPHGVGRNNGAFRQKLNDGYSGYYVSFTTLL